MLERLSYDPHGKRRNVNWTPAAGTLSAIHTDRGFTGHEHLDELGLIHMNGRVYDPVLGRFLSADPYIQYPDATQGLNRYSYVQNNPLSLTDPSGLFLGKVFKSIGKAFGSLFKAIGRVLTNPRALLAFAVNFIPIPGMNIALATAIRGFGSGLIAGRGDFRAGVIGAISAGWGRMIGPVGTLKNFVGQTAGGGVFSKLSGGRFSDGLRIGGAIGFAQWSLFQVQTAVAENSGGVGELQGVGVDDKGNATLGAPTRTGTLSVNGVGDFSLRAAVDRVGMTTFDAFIPPSTSTFADILETGLSMVTGRSAVSDQLADILKNSNYTNLIGHSQGAQILAQAVNTLDRAALAGVNVRLLGGAVSESYARTVMSWAGARLEYKANFFDPVSSIFSGNPVRMFPGMIGAASVPFSSINQHTYQCKPLPASC